LGKLKAPNYGSIIFVAEQYSYSHDFRQSFPNLISLPLSKINKMEALVKILLMDEKKVKQLNVLYNELMRNIENETGTDKENRIHLGLDIAAIKKTNAIIVSHCLKEHTLSQEAINKIMDAHKAA
jgi:hypothetical protein